MPPSTQFIESLAAKGITATARRYLIDNGDRLEALATKVINNPANVTPADRTELKAIYTEYSRRALIDRAELLRGGSALAKTAKNPDEIRSDFFNGPLGRIGVTETDRIALRAAIVREAIEKKADIILANGQRVSQAEADALKAQQRIGMVMSPADTTRLNAINQAEAAAAQAAQTAANTRARRIELRDSAVENRRGIERTQATEAEAAGKAIFKQDVELRHTVAKLESVYRTTGTIDVQDAFSALRSQLTADTNKLLLVKNLERPDMAAPKDIMRSIQDGNPITEREFTDLQTFFHNYDPSMRRGAPAIPSSSTSPIVGATPTAMAMNFGRDIINMATREGASSSIPLRLRTLYETGSEPNFFRRNWSGIVENPIVRRGAYSVLGVSILAPTVATLFGGVFDPSKYDANATTIWTLVHQNWMSPSTIKDLTKSEVTSNLYFRMVTGGGFANPMFAQYTKDLTGVSLFVVEKDKDGNPIKDKDGKDKMILDPDFAAGSDRTLLRLLQIANKLPSNAVSGYNEEAIEAYKFALAKFSGMEVSAYKDSASIVNHLTDKIAENTASRMTTDVALRNKKLIEFYGTTTLSQDELVKRFIESNNQDAILRRTVAHYLVLQKALKPEDITVDGLTKLKQTLAEAESATIKATREGIENERDQRVRQGDRDQAARFYGRESSSTPQRASPERIQGQFNRLANDTLYPELKGKGSALMRAFEASRTGEEFEEALKKEQIPAETIRPLRELAFGR